LIENYTKLSFARDQDYSKKMKTYQKPNLLLYKSLNAIVA